ncbi:MAG: undecaprenyl/decaprenyl-phosphate alpha-N-acetylglucosaminyl 1-phosphate transferase [Candidatus Omnitrophica bacterium]|nr:undecaprenyl/decaprenyl-phosphate alpha-N-acetylglucosaminyl 1-phosphate transferase [Candidatus Omnitrophota bacterium]MBU1996341.1 undecaprenyl/decaprenyl-phosphate alpha-N-acetylglucosaminyl 1-phosphate transferase [Candidatus Omnitrophota bacterium]MBU4332929.1 undecaprenyl/decaprenyl-phosphate alpha-N-acetylglucosaminyl 1-phosphate transferase [Candidatus Omnitrophota bacterium]
MIKFLNHFKEQKGVVLNLVYIMFFAVFVGILSLYIKTRYDHWISPLANYGVLSLLAAFISIIFTPVIIYFANNVKAIDQTRSKRYQKIPTPLLGGISIYFAVVLTLLFHRSLDPQLLSIIIGGTIIFVIGTIDDIYPLSSTLRLFSQLAASIIIMSSGLIVSFMPNNLIGNIIACLITFIWILGIINATNFFDGADGLAAGVSGIAALFFFIIALHLEQRGLCVLAAAVIGACIGFLFFNFKPAKIYLGDGGSTFLGFCLASIALYGGWSSRTAFAALGIPVLILSPLIFDMIYITIARIYNKKVRSFRQWLDYTARDHLHHRLINMGFKEKYAVLWIYLFGSAMGMSALGIEHAKMSYPIVLELLTTMIIFISVSIIMITGKK